MSRRWAMADLHLGHKNICKYRTQFSTPDEHHWTVYENVCSTVGKRDAIYFLGDVAFTEEWLEKIGEIKCQTKILILGNHCVSMDTEILTKDGWKLSKDITYSDLVASVDLIKNTVSYHNPDNIKKIENCKMYNVKGSYIDELVSDGHNSIYKDCRTPVNSIEGEHSCEDFKYCSFQQENLVDDSHEWVKLITWVVCDGCLVQGETKNKKRVQFKLSKPRKISALEELLNNLSIPYTKRLCKKYGINVLQPYYIRIYGDSARKIWDYLGGVKRFPKNWTFMQKDKVQSVIKTLAQTDGTQSFNVITLVSVCKEDVDTLQTMFALNGVPCNYQEKVNGTGFKNGKLQYVMNIYTAGHKLTKSRNVKVKRVENSNMTTIGIQVKQGTLITRRNGKVSITGNCTDRINFSKFVGIYDKVYSLFSKENFWLTHCPIHESELRKNELVVHGHTHDILVNDPRYVNVCMENIDFKPYLFTKDSIYELRYKQEEIKRLNRG